jgi:hypothetical protein
VCTHFEHQARTINILQSLSVCASATRLDTCTETNMHKDSKKEKEYAALISSTTSKEVTPSETRPDYRPSASSLLT